MKKSFVNKMLLAASLTALFSQATYATTATWTPVTGTNSWDSGGNWTPATFPNAIGDIANITGNFTADQTINLNVPITVGTLTINDTGANPDNLVIIAAGTAGDLTIQGTGASITNGSNAINVISANVTFNSATTINTGTLNTASGVNFTGSLAGSVDITKTGTQSTLQLSGNNSAFTGNWILSGGVASTSILNIAGDSSLGAVPATARTNITVTNDNELLFSSAGAQSLNANRNILISGGSLTFGTTFTSTQATIGGVISGVGGVGRLTGAPASIITLAGLNTYTGATTVSSGVLKAGSTSAFGNNSAVVMGTGGGAKLDLAGFSNSVGSLAGGAASVGGITLGTGTLTTGGNNTSTSYAGVISGGTGGGLTKVGTGVQTLTAANTYTGATLVNGGTLLVNGSNPSSAVTVANTATFGGSGTVANVTAQTGGTLAPGASSTPGSNLGTLTVNNLTLAASSNYTFELNTDGAGVAGTNWDSLLANGILTTTGLTSVNPFNLKLQTLDGSSAPGALASWDGSVNHTWANVIDFTTLTGTFASNLFNVDTTGFVNSHPGAFSLILNGTALDLQYTAAVPEPSSVALLAMGVAGLFAARRRFGRSARVTSDI